MLMSMQFRYMFDNKMIVGTSLWFFNCGANNLNNAYVMRYMKGYLLFHQFNRIYSD